MEWVALAVVGWLGFMLMSFITKNTGKYKKNKNEASRSHDNWLLYDEPKYRYTNTYPPDWYERKLHCQKRDNFKCQQCNYTIYFDAHSLERAKDLYQSSANNNLHVHHKIPLSRGGNNTLENLISLCEDCHEDQHPHMLRMRLARYRKKEQRARAPAMKAEWRNRVSYIEARLARAVQAKP